MSVTAERVRVLDVPSWWSMATEVERNWLLDGISPDVALGEAAPMRQG